MRYLIKRNGKIKLCNRFFSALSVFLWLLYNDMYSIIDILLQIFTLSYFICKYEINLDIILIKINKKNLFR